MSALKDTHSRGPTVDAIVNRILPTRGCSGGKRFQRHSILRSGSGDVGKELPRNKFVVSVLFGGELAQKHQQETFPGCMFVAGIILRVNHCCTRCSPHIAFFSEYCLPLLLPCIFCMESIQCCTFSFRPDASWMLLSTLSFLPCDHTGQGGGF